MEKKEIAEASRKAELNEIADIIEHTFNQESIEYDDIVILYQYNKVAVHGVSTNLPYEVSHILLEYDIILEGVTRVTNYGGVNLFFRQVSIEQVDVIVTENHIVPSM